MIFLANVGSFGEGIPGRERIRNIRNTILLMVHDGTIEVSGTVIAWEFLTVNDNAVSLSVWRPTGGERPPKLEYMYVAMFSIRQRSTIWK